MVSWIDLAGVVVFYSAILGVGVWASRKGSSPKKGDSTSKAPLTDAENAMLAGRSIGPLVGLFTMTATWVGGGYINGTAEMVFSKSILACQAPFGYALSLVVGGLFFAKKMRDANYVTMLDPFQQLYGEKMGALLIFPSLLGGVFGASAVFGALGATLSVVIEVNRSLAIIISSAVTVCYTLVGGLFAVAYTDVVQLLCIVVGILICVPFAISNPVVAPLSTDVNDLIGTMGSDNIGQFVDIYLLLIFGGIPWHEYFQRILSNRSSRNAQILSCIAGVFCVIFTIPPFMIGYAAKSANWTATEYAKEIPKDEESFVLPLTLRYLCPWYARFFGLGAVSAAVMSSADSYLLAASSLFSKNIYQVIIRKKASDREILWVMRATTLAVGGASCALAISSNTIYGMWYLCSDLVYVILFPQLISVLYLPWTNTYGSLAGYIVGFVLRVGGGEPLLYLPTFIYYPWCQFDDNGVAIQHFPFRTFSMICSFATLILISLLSRSMLRNGWIPQRFDMTPKKMPKHFEIRQSSQESRQISVDESLISRQGSSQTS